jgi:small conductance mechanosensitive channel
MDMIGSWLQQRWFPIIITIVIAYCIARFSGLLLIPLIKRLAGRLHTDLTHEDVIKRQDTLISLSRTLIKVTVWLIAIFIILRIFGLDLTPLLAGAGVLGVALGFGAQSLIKDFLSGLFIILENQYRVGDVVDLEGSAGTVEHITVRSTVIRDADGNVHYIPNGNIMRVINKTMGFSAINLTIAVQPNTNIDHLAEIINEVGEALAQEEAWKDKILEAPHFLSIGNFSDIALEIKITGKTQPSRQWGVTGELRKRLLGSLKKHHFALAQLPGSISAGSSRK